MSFYHTVKSLAGFDFASFFDNVDSKRVKSALYNHRLSEEDFLCLLSPSAGDFLEEMAQKAHSIALNHFGRTVLLYTPIYLANYCVNKCTYCGFNAGNGMERKKLDLEEVESEARTVHALGFRHIIILTGESRLHTPVSYIRDCVLLLKKYFSSISIEIYPLEEWEYRYLIEAGVDGLTIYQEVYTRATYAKVHPAGPKSNYRYRLEAVDRAARAGIHSVSVGALLGLDDWRREAFFTGIHGKYIQDYYPGVELTLSAPRIRPHAGIDAAVLEITDKNLVQALLAYKIFLQRAGINITTRERAELRDNLIPLGVTKMSAAVSTRVGGHSNQRKSESQFEIADERSVEETLKAIRLKGYNPIFKDWEPLHVR